MSSSPWAGTHLSLRFYRRTIFFSVGRFSLHVVPWLSRFLPTAVPVRWQERLRTGLGALAGLAVIGVVMRMLPGLDTGIPFLVAPMGASAVLLFGVPASPLAQPWSILGGNIVSALVGVTCARLIADPAAAAAIAVGVSLCAMFTLRCVHPPSGAVALTAVLGGPSIHALGYGFVVAPIAAQSVLLLACALAYHALTGHRYPHAAARPEPARAGGESAEPARYGFSRADLEAVLSERDEMLDIDPDDLESVLRETQARAYARTLNEVTAAEVMSRDVISVSPETPAAQAWALLQRHRIKALPVVDAERHVVGIVTRTDLAHNAPGRRRLALVRDRLPAWGRGAADSVARRMSAQVRTVPADASISELLRLFAGLGHHHIPVVNAQRQLAGIVTQADVISGLYTQACMPEPRAA